MDHKTEEEEEEEEKVRTFFYCRFHIFPPLLPYKSTKV